MRKIDTNRIEVLSVSDSHGNLLIENPLTQYLRRCRRSINCIIVADICIRANTMQLLVIHGGL